mgnify:FL=1
MVDEFDVLDQGEFEGKWTLGPLSFDSQEFTTSFAVTTVRDYYLAVQSGAGRVTTYGPFKIRVNKEIVTDC